MPEGCRETIVVHQIVHEVAGVSPGHVYYEGVAENGFKFKIIALDDLSLMLISKKPMVLYHMEVNDKEESAILFVNLEKMGALLNEVFTESATKTEYIKYMLTEIRTLKSRLQIH